MGRKEQFLTKVAKKTVDAIYESTDLSIKEIMSAGVLAFADLPPEKKIEYVSRSKMGDLEKPPFRQGTPDELKTFLKKLVSGADPSGKTALRFTVDHLSSDDQRLLDQLRNELSADAARADETAAASAAAGPKGKHSRRTG
jgi:hypothetical protein